MGERLLPGTGIEGVAASRPGNDLPATTTNNTGFSGGADGTVDRVLRREPRSKFTGAIFIHAGAGFHSHQNEQVHLEACKE